MHPLLHSCPIDNNAPLVNPVNELAILASLGRLLGDGKM